eukprot:jgi/Astpho2/9139/Aster-07787
MDSTALQDDEVGQLQALSCPYLAKLHPALLATKLVQGKPRAFGNNTVVLYARHGVEMHMAYFPNSSLLVVAVKMSEQLKYALTKTQAELTVTENLYQPKWLGHLAPQAKIHIIWASIFHSLKGPQDGCLGDCVKMATGDLIPRRVLCTGYCGGGAMATVAAVWMALQCPTADVRCITFGSPRVGNAAFCEAFKWLVGRSYRVVYRRDPSPSRANHAVMHSLVHVHGAIYIASDRAEPGKQPSEARAHGGCEADHDFERYAEAMYASVARHFEEMQAFRGGKPMVMFATACNELAGDEDEASNTSSRHAAGRPSPAKSDVNTGAAHAVRELKAGHRRGMPTQDKQPVPDAMQLEGAVAQDAGLPPGDAMPLQASQRRVLAQNRFVDSAPGNDKAERTVSDAVHAATDDRNTDIGLSDGEGGGSEWLKRAFSVLELEDVELHLEQLDTLGKVLVVGKVSQAVVLSWAAYRDEATFRDWTGIENSKLVCDSTFDTQVHVGWLPGGTAVMAFRGTENAQDGLQDMKIIRKNIDYLQALYPGVQAHTGFMQQFAAVSSMAKPEENLAEVIKQLSGGQDPNRVQCCGHSLGGALATLAATWASMTYPQADVRCITFGSPRVGNQVFKNAFQSMVGTSIRVVHRGDLIPALPPALAYKHVENCLHLRRGQILLRDRPWRFKLRLNVGDHLVSSYTAGIWAHRPHGEPQLPFLGRKKKHDTKRHQAEDDSGHHAATAHQHHSFSLWRLLSCMPALGLEDRLQTEEDEQHTDKIPAHLPAVRSSSDRVSVGDG